MLILTTFSILWDKGKLNQGVRNDLLSDVDKRLDKHNTQKELSKDLGWSTGKIATADVVWKRATEEFKEEGYYFGEFAERNRYS